MAPQKPPTHRRARTERAAASAAPADSVASATPSTSPTGRPGLRDVHVRQDLAAAGRQEGSPAMLVTALIGTTLFIGAYFHLLALNQMTQLSGGLAMPDNMLGYGPEHIAALAAAMDEAARGQLNWVHKTAGVIFAVTVALTVSAVGAWRLRQTAAKWGALALGVTFAVVDIWEGLAIEAAIAAGGPGAELASALTLTRWVLLALIALSVPAMLVLGRRRRHRP
ncbi:hypothetical protein [Micrococcus sp.]|uniref:hypothetical protein n=1 Tax=Micrococcus sp. TaxID=1271 RepID=UPI002A911731|nr:hypothetical protein [Micrococcus sp.]MDY6055755.1 hypothetical protein [Micrococcus sp.]